MFNEDQQIKDFMEAIERYYPKGVNADRKNHSGFQQLLKITEDKNNGAVNGLPIEWFQFAGEIKNLWEGYHVVNLPATPFPAYQIRMLQHGEPKPEFARMVILSVSLLVKYYTLFVKEVWKQGDDDRKTILSNAGQPDANLSSRISQTKQVVNKYYSDYNFADPQILFMHKVPERFAFEATKEELGKNVIYEYLFSHDMTGEPYVFM